MLGIGWVTPNPGRTLGDLIDHVGGVALAFAAAAAKDLGQLTGPAPVGDASLLDPDWRTRIPRDLATMAAAWQDPSAWTGQTRVGAVDLPGEVAGLAPDYEAAGTTWWVESAPSGSGWLDQATERVSRGP